MKSNSPFNEWNFERSLILSFQVQSVFYPDSLTSTLKKVDVSRESSN